VSGTSFKFLTEQLFISCRRKLETLDSWKVKINTLSRWTHGPKNKKTLIVVKYKVGDSSQSSWPSGQYYCRLAMVWDNFLGFKWLVVWWQSVKKLCLHHPKKKERYNKVAHQYPRLVVCRFSMYEQSSESLSGGIVTARQLCTPLQIGELVWNIVWVFSWLGLARTPPWGCGLAPVRLELWSRSWHGWFLEQSFLVRTRKLCSRNQPCHERDHSSKRDRSLSG